MLRACSFGVRVIQDGGRVQTRPSYAPGVESICLLPIKYHRLVFVFLLGQQIPFCGTWYCRPALLQTVPKVLVPFISSFNGGNSIKLCQDFGIPLISRMEETPPGTFSVHSFEWNST